VAPAQETINALHVAPLQGKPPTLKEEHCWEGCPVPEVLREPLRPWLRRHCVLEKVGRRVQSLEVEDFLATGKVVVQGPAHNRLDDGVRDQRAVKVSVGCPIIDVRSPGEFAKGHVPGAVNSPLFDDSQRHEVGRLYATEGKHRAVELGIEFVPVALERLVSNLQKLGISETGGDVLVMCWRGGMRSMSVAWFLGLLGHPVRTMKGGYKGFRTWVLRQVGEVPRNMPSGCSLEKQPANDGSQRNICQDKTLDDLEGEQEEVTADFVKRHLMKAQNAMTNGSKEFALKVFTRLACLSQGKAGPFVALEKQVLRGQGACLQAMGKHLEAIEVLTESLGAKHVGLFKAGNLKSLQLRMNSLITLCRLGEAEEDLNEVLSMEPHWRQAAAIQERISQKKAECKSAIRHQGSATQEEASADPWDVTFGQHADEDHQQLVLPSTSPQVVVLSGPTGSGKTDMLHWLANQGEQILDLEGLAHHRASAFGAVGMPAQPGNEMYQNLLAIAWVAFDPTRRIWVEHEDKHVGHCVLPQGISHWLQEAPGGFVWVDMPRELRVQRLVRDYCAGSCAQTADTGVSDVSCTRLGELKASVSSLRRRWGDDRVRRAHELLDQGDFASVAADALEYYDRLYHRHAEQQAERMERSGASNRVVRIRLDTSEDAAVNGEAVLKAVLAMDPIDVSGHETCINSRS